MFLGILQVISLSRTLASQSTPATVITIVMQELTRFSFWCYEKNQDMSYLTFTKFLTSTLIELK